MKSASEAHIGDTFHHLGQTVEILPGFQPAQSMVFAGIFPVDTNDFRKLDDNIKKLTLNDASVTVHKETSHALGQGWRLGFLGTLHMDVFRQRLENVSLRSGLCMCFVNLSDPINIRNMMPTSLSLNLQCHIKVYTGINPLGTSLLY